MDSKFYMKFLLIWLVNSLVIWVANALYPGNVVLGTASTSLIAAVIISGFLVTLLCKIVKILFVKLVHLKKTSRLIMFVFYWLVNAAVIWLIARLAPFTGLGISSFYWAIVLGFVLNFFQWVMRQILKIFSLEAKK